MFDEASILSRIDDVCASLEAAEPPRHAMTAAERIPLFRPHTLELDEQRRIASEEWQEVQEDRYRLFQRTIDPVWSVDVRFAGRVPADTGKDMKSPELGKSGPRQFNPRGQRSAAAALLDAESAAKLISSITPRTAARLADEIANDATMDENVRLSLAHRLTAQARAIAERPQPTSQPSAGAPALPQFRRSNTMASSYGDQPPALSRRGTSASVFNDSASTTSLFSATSTAPPLRRSTTFAEPDLPPSPRRATSFAFNPSASSTSLFGGVPNESAAALFPVQPQHTEDKMLQFQADRNFDSAVANSMRRISGIVEGTKERPLPSAHPDKVRQQAELRREVSKLQAVKELKSMSMRANGGMHMLVAPPSLRSSHSRLFLPRRTTRANVSLMNGQFDRQWASTLSLHNKAEAASNLKRASSMAPNASRPKLDRRQTSPPALNHARSNGLFVSAMQRSPTSDAALQRSPTSDAMLRRSPTTEATFDDYEDVALESVPENTRQTSSYYPASSDDGSEYNSVQPARRPATSRQPSRAVAAGAARPSSATSKRVNADGATNERLYRHGAVKAAHLAQRMQQAAEEREQKEAAERRSKPQISDYARSLPRLSSEVQFNRISRPTIDKQLMQNFAQATEADAFPFAPQLCENSAKMLEARHSTAAASAPAGRFLDSFRA